MKLILASQSEFRKDLLKRLDYPFEVQSSSVDEASVKKDNLSPVQICQLLGKLKAKNIFDRFPQAVVIGSDQVVSLGDTIFDKPKTAEKACEQLSKLQGQTHYLHTSIAVYGPNFYQEALNSSQLFMRPLRSHEIENYVQKDKPFQCAGSYKLESFGIKLFKKIETSDYTSIIGLPLIQLQDILLDYEEFL
jgi:septum formation protein